MINAKLVKQIDDEFQRSSQQINSLDDMEAQINADFDEAGIDPDVQDYFINRGGPNDGVMMAGFVLGVLCATRNFERNL
jgi:hypothetical protein